ncbi:MAG TPA: hypothetical protein VKZ53_29200 [Candidatus Angelobacter sp.]|nr:hypothetical protein [Candidatus Angelobacter sp.]
MNHEEYEPTTEAWLEEALQAYGNVAPRPGLEDRIIANLRSQQRRQRLRHRMIFAACAAGLLLAVATVNRWSVQPRTPNVAVVRPVSSPVPDPVKPNRTTSEGSKKEIKHELRNSVATVPSSIFRNPVFGRPAGGGPTDGKPGTIPVPRPSFARERLRIEKENVYLSVLRAPPPEPAIAAQPQARALEIQGLSLSPIEVKEFTRIKDLD